MIVLDAIDRKAAAKPASPAPRRARVVVLGEFSAGKSTFINLLTGGDALRTQVTATQMPAVWLSHGDGAPVRVDLDGGEHPVDPSDPDSISVADTAYVRVFRRTPALELCDLIDTPGNGDPNIPAAAWERVAALADVAVWLTPSTQAWRQSELAAWRGVPEAVRARSILLLTRADKLISDADRTRVMRRAQREAGGHFARIHMASLLDFAEVRPVLRDLIELCNGVGGAQAEASAVDALAPAAPADAPEPVAAATVDADGYAAATWARLTRGLTADDTAAVDAATAAFLAELDAALAPSGVKDRATTLWREGTEAIEDGDAAALAPVFDRFLATVDAELGALAMREAG